MDHETRSAVGLVAVSGGKMAECFTLQCWGSQTMHYKDALWCLCLPNLLCLPLERAVQVSLGSRLPPQFWLRMSIKFHAPTPNQAHDPRQNHFHFSLPCFSFSAEKHDYQRRWAYRHGFLFPWSSGPALPKVCFLCFALLSVMHSTSFLFMEANRNTFCCLQSKTRKW